MGKKRRRGYAVINRNNEERNSLRYAAAAAAKDGTCRRHPGLHHIGVLHRLPVACPPPFRERGHEEFIFHGPSRGGCSAQLNTAAPG